MKTYWKYVDKDSPEFFAIYLRDYKTKMERMVYNSEGLLCDEGWEEFAEYNIEDERTRFFGTTITRISKDDAFLEMI